MKHPFTLSFISQLKFILIIIAFFTLECSEEEEEDGGEARAESLCRGLGLRFCPPPPPPLAGLEVEDLFRGVSSRKFETGGGEFAGKVASSSKKRVLGRLAGRCSADLAVAVGTGGGGGGEGAAAAAVRLVNVVDKFYVLVL